MPAIKCIFYNVNARSHIKVKFDAVRRKKCCKDIHEIIFTVWRRTSLLALHLKHIPYRKIQCSFADQVREVRSLIFHKPMTILFTKGAMQDYPLSLGAKSFLTTYCYVNFITICYDKGGLTDYRWLPWFLTAARAVAGHVGRWGTHRLGDLQQVWKLFCSTAQVLPWNLSQTSKLFLWMSTYFSSYITIIYLILLISKSLVHFLK